MESGANNFGVFGSVIMILMVATWFGFVFLLFKLLYKQIKSIEATTNFQKDVVAKLDRISSHLETRILKP